MTLPPPSFNRFLLKLLVITASVTVLPVHASYTVLDDDLYPSSYLEARNSEQARLEQSQKTLQFPRQRTMLTKSTVATLDSLLPLMSNTSVRIVGRPDAGAQKQGPLSNLAGDRAMAIRDYLLKKGIPGADIKMETDESPNPQRNGSMYPSYIYLSPKPAARTEYTRDAARYEEAPQAISGSTVSISSGTITTPVTSSGATPSPNADLIRLINSAVAKNEMSASVAVQLLERLAPKNPTWEILATDRTLQNTLERWGKLASWDIKWIGVPEIKNPGDVSLPASDFLTAASTVLNQAQRAAKAAGIDLLITAYPNRVLVISKAIK